MSTELHVLAGSRLLGSFRLARGMHVLVGSESADLLWSSRDAPTDICRVELGAQGAVTVGPIDDAAIHVFGGATIPEARLANGDVAGLGALRLIVPDRSPAPEMQVVTPAPVEQTAPSHWRWALALVATAVLPACCNDSASRLTVEPRIVQFDALVVGQKSTQMVPVTNASSGDMDLVICGPQAPCSAPDFQLPTLPLKLAAGQSVQVPITFAPISVGAALHEVAGFAGVTPGCVTNCRVIGVVEVQLLGVSTFPGGCIPPPGFGITNQFIVGSASFSDSIVQASFGCATTTLIDGGHRPVGDGGLGDPCTSELDCPETCCACPRDCASFTAGACILGTCAPSSVSCLIGQVQVPGVCPDGGSDPPEVNGTRSFPVLFADANISADSGVTVRLLGGDGATACGAAGGSPRLVLTLPSAGLSVLSVGEVYASVQGALTLGDAGSIAASDGRVFLAPIDGGLGGLVTGAFDIAFPPSDELWGSLSAGICP